MAKRVHYVKDPLLNPDDDLLSLLDRLTDRVERGLTKRAIRGLRFISGSRQSSVAMEYAAYITLDALWVSAGHKPTDEERQELAATLFPSWSSLTGGTQNDLLAALTSGATARHITPRQQLAAMAVVMVHVNRKPSSFRDQLIRIFRAGNEPPLDRTLSDIDTAYERGDGQLLERKALAALRTDPQCGRAFIALAEVMRVRHRPLIASRYVRAAVVRTPDDPWIPFTIIRVLMQWAVLSNMASIAACSAILATGSSSIFARVCGFGAFAFCQWLGVSDVMRMGTRALRLVVRTPVRRYWRLLIVGPVAAGSALALLVAAVRPQIAEPICIIILIAIAATLVMDVPFILRPSHRSVTRREITLSK